MHLQVLNDDAAFKVRAAALIVRDGRVLLNHVQSGGAWMLPGGTGEFGESSETTLRRELREELGVETAVGRLLWVVEHFFVGGPRRWHQLLWVHEAALPEDCAIVRKETWESAGSDGVDRFRWTPLSDLHGVRLIPGFLADAIANVPNAPVRVVHRDPLP